MSSSACPNDEELKAFAVGNLSMASYERVEDHVTQCASCDALLQTYDGYSDSLVSQLRLLGSDDPDPKSTDAIVSPKLSRSAPADASRSARQSSSELSIDPGRRLARQLTDGPCHLGRFELLDELGIGSYGYVFRAYDPQLDRTVAIKVQRAGDLASKEDVERFFREARSVAQLKHPAIVSLYETGHTEDDICYLVTELVDGQTLEHGMSVDKPDVRPSALHIAELADALHYAHERGVIHRDIKPSNILIDSDGRPHIMDFGLAKRETGDVTMTFDGQVMGTPAYMSPEQARGESHQVDARTDVYSLGVVLYEMLTGERPFQGNRRMLLLQVLQDEPRPPRQLDEKIPRDLQTICLKAMAKLPARRYRTAQEFGDDLRRYLDGQPIHARPISKWERLWRWCRRYPMAASLMLAVSLGPAFGLLHLSRLSHHFVRQAALGSAQMQSEMLEEINAFYSEIVRGLEPDQVGISVDQAHYTKVPYPASFSIEAGRRISRSQTGMQMRLYSNYPFPWRKDGGPRDDFGRDALDELERNPKLPFYVFTEIDGRPVVRYAIARVMKSSCIDCHNTHPQSPKRDWQEGDVRGVLEIIRPLDRDIKRTRSGLRGTFVLMGAISALLVGIGVSALIGARARNQISK